MNRFNFGVKLNFSISHSLSRCTLRKNPLSVNNIVLIVQCRKRMGRGAVKDMFLWQRQKIAFLGLLQVYFVQLGHNISNKFNFGVKFLTHIFKVLVLSRSHYWLDQFLTLTLAQYIDFVNFLQFTGIVYHLFCSF